MIDNNEETIFNEHDEGDIMEDRAYHLNLVSNEKLKKIIDKVKKLKNKSNISSKDVEALEKSLEEKDVLIKYYESNQQKMLVAEEKLVDKINQMAIERDDLEIKLGSLKEVNQLTFGQVEVAGKKYAIPQLVVDAYKSKHPFRLVDFFLGAFSAVVGYMLYLYFSK